VSNLVSEHSRTVSIVCSELQHIARDPQADTSTRGTVDQA